MEHLNLNKNTDNLDAIRENIDTIDLKILELFKLRFEQVLQVWEYKSKYDLQPLQPDRWNQVLNNRVQVAEQLWLDKDFIITIWNIIHDEALQLEHKVTNTANSEA